MTTRVLAGLATLVLSGCTTDAVVRGFVLPDCSPGPMSSQTAHAARCMTAALYEIAQEKRENSDDEASESREDDGDSDASE